MSKPPPLNREAWLNKLALMLRPWFRDAGYPVHGRISVSMAKLPPMTAGLCSMQKHKDDMNHIFISVYEDGEMADPVTVGGVLVHELLHAVLPAGASHGAPFKKAMVPLGLVGKATSTDVGPKLNKHLTALLDQMPPLPRFGIVRPPKPPTTGGGKSGMMRFQCPSCRISVFIKYTSLERAGDPVCWNPDCEDQDVMIETTTAKV